MVVWCICNLHRDGSSFMGHQPCQRIKYTTSVDVENRAMKSWSLMQKHIIVQELCESRGGRPGLSVLTSLMVSVDVKIY